MGRGKEGMEVLLKIVTREPGFPVGWVEGNCCSPLPSGVDVSDTKPMYSKSECSASCHTVPIGKQNESYPMLFNHCKIITFAKTDALMRSHWDLGHILKHIIPPNS